VRLRRTGEQIFLLYHPPTIVQNGSELREGGAIPLSGLITRAIACAISCAICCISQMQFAASAIWFPTRNCYRSITRTMQFRVRFGVRFGACDLVHVRCLCNCKTDTNRTPNRICDLVQKKIESNSCRTPNRRYTKSHLRYAANCT
jgi:hypothetical protein